VTILVDGSFFIPRWTGVPDDAGGYWHSASSPEGRDMYGLGCTEPLVLADNCGRAGWSKMVPASQKLWRSGRPGSAVSATTDGSSDSPVMCGSRRGRRE
jgi:hypothetical protein